MEAFFHFVALVFAAIVWLMFHTFFAVCQAIAGVLYPTRNHVMARYQRFALAFLIPSVALLLVGAGAALLFQWHTLALWTITPGIIAALIGGVFGHRAEVEFKRSE